MRKPLLALFFFCGVAAAIHEAAWSRTLAIQVGDMLSASFTVTGAYLLSLALGSIAGSRWGRSPGAMLWRLAGTEIGLGLYGFLFPYLAVLLGMVRPGAGRLLGPDLAGPLLYLTILAVPGFLVGAKLPLMHGLYLRKDESPARQVGAVALAFALGIAAGEAAAFFALIPHLGIKGTGRAAVLLNMALFFSLVAFRRWRPLEEEKPGRGSLHRTGAAFVDEIRSSVVFASTFCTAFALSGLVILWTRILGFFTVSHAFTLPAVQVTCLAALCCGALALCFSRRSKAPHFGTGGAILFIGGGAVCLALCTIPWIHGVMQSSGTGGMAGYLVSSMAAAGCLLFPGAVLLGMIPPLSLSIQVEEGGEGCREAGLVYGTACLGASFGLLSAQWFVVPSLGLKLGVMVSGFMAIAASLLMTVFSRTRPAPKAMVLLGKVVLIWGIAWFISGRGELSRALIHDSSVFKDQDRESHLILEQYSEGSDGSASLVRDFAARAHRLYIEDQPCVADDAAFPWQHLLAHLPVMASPGPEKVLVLGYGMGIVVDSIALHPEILRVEVTEPCGAALEIARGLSSASRLQGILLHGGVHGRDFLLHSAEGFDVITVTPRHPYLPQAATLYTRTFYDLCRKRLNLDGVLCQWLPLYSLPGDLFRAALKTFMTSLPDAGCFLVGDSLILLGFARPGWSLDYARMKRIFDMPAVRSEFMAAGFDSPAALAGAYIGDRAFLLKKLADDAVLEDDHIMLDRLAVETRSDGARNRADNIVFLLPLEASFPERIVLENSTPEAVQDLHERVRRYRLSAGHYLKGLAAEAEPGGAWQSAFKKAFYLNPDDRRAARRYARILVGEALEEIERGSFSLAQEITAKAAAIAPELWDVYMAEAFLSLAAGNLSELEQMVEIMRQLQPYANLILAFKIELADEDAVREHHRKLLEKSGGLTVPEERLLNAAREARARGSARYALPSRELALDLLSHGPEARNGSGRLAWAVARNFDAALLEEVKEDLLRLLEEEGRDFNTAVTGLGFFDDALVRKKLGDLFRERTGPERGLLLESLARAGDVDTVVSVLEEASLPVSLRVKATQIVSELKIAAAVGPLIDLLENPDASLRLGAFVALLHLTRMHFDYDPNGPEAQRARSVERWRYWFELQQPKEE